MFKHILLATDGSPASTHAAKLAVGLARIHGAKLMAVYVMDPYPYLGVGESNPYGFQAYMAEAQKHAAQAHAEVETLCTHGGAPVTWRYAHWKIRQRLRVLCKPPKTSTLI
jgi:nucleotide-binding universal stress UspA family protein